MIAVIVLYDRYHLCPANTIVVLFYFYSTCIFKATLSFLSWHYPIFFSGFYCLLYLLCYFGLVPAYNISTPVPLHCDFFKRDFKCFSDDGCHE